MRGMATHPFDDGKLRLRFHSFCYHVEVESPGYAHDPADDRLTNRVSVDSPDERAVDLDHIYRKIPEPAQS